MSHNIKLQAYNSDDNEMYGDEVAKLNLYRESIGDPIPERFTLRQWTGLTDKSGNDIYEGDILKGSRGYYTEVKDRNDFIIYAHEEPYWFSDQKIVGNIFQNKELLNFNL